jgi:4-amino-4-deoxy-L-arabinose transferase-like glycosyltransferase
MPLIICWLLIAFVHSLRPHAVRTNRFQYNIGLVLSLLFGISTLWISMEYSDFAFFESDFSEYCVAVYEMEQDWHGGDIPPKRTRLAALLPTVLAQLNGVVNGLAMTSILCTVLTFVLVYVWGTALAGTGGGVLSVGVLWMMSPMELMPRFLTFYPPIVLTTVFAASCLALWGRFRTPWTALLCGLGIALCLLIDVRGVLWAFPFWIGAVCLLSWNLKVSNVLSALALHLPIWASWFLAWWSYPSNASSLEKQMDVRPLYVGFDEGNPLFRPPWEMDSHFVWGWFQPQEILQTVSFIWTQQQFSVPIAFNDWQSSTDGPVAEVEFWWVAVLFSLLAGCWVMWKRTFGKSGLERILILLCTISPFIVLFHSLEDLVEQNIRFYMHVSPGIAILLGVGLAQRLPLARVFVSLPLSTLWKSICWLVCMMSLLIFMHLSEDSPMSPSAEWRHTWRLNALDWGRIKRSQTTDVSLRPYDETCAERLKDEVLIPTVYP